MEPAESKNLEEEKTEKTPETASEAGKPETKPESGQPEPVQEAEPESQPEPETSEQEVQEPRVEQTEEQGNGVRLEDLVTKDDLAERLSAFEAKFEAILAENKALTEKLAQMSEKYEEHDFGGFARQGVQQKDSFANETFDSYSKQFL